MAERRRPVLQLEQLERLAATPDAPYRAAWLALTPAERLRRSWALRGRLLDPRKTHDAKLFPRP